MACTKLLIRPLREAATAENTHHRSRWPSHLVPFDALKRSVWPLRRGKQNSPLLPLRNHVLLATQEKQATNSTTGRCWRLAGFRIPGVQSTDPVLVAETVAKNSLTCRHRATRLRSRARPSGRSDSQLLLGASATESAFKTARWANIGPFTSLFMDLPILPSRIARPWCC